MNGPQQYQAEDLLNDVIEGKAGSLKKFRSVVQRRARRCYLSPTRNDLTWCTPKNDIDELYNSGSTGRELLRALGMKGWSNEDAIEIFYPSSLVKSFYKPCAIHAGVDPLFRQTPVEWDYGQTSGGLKEFVHEPLAVVDALVGTAGLRLWRM